ncbi:hypothetical protein VKT23_019739 [Stygiomarasmius scandens]|uniref:CxC1-like cysteine cluster associated with KDZ transposases domain-containing protein n=1 Tax=Marasmiellus scandens TaxID=2682957 RepID=A0ABR1INK4_9AGAR
MGIRTRLRAPTNAESSPSRPEPRSSLSVRETTVCSSQPRREDEEPQVHLSHGQGLYQVCKAFHGTRTHLPEVEAIVNIPPFEPLPSPSKHASKREKGLNRWKTQVSNLVTPYLDLLRETDNLRLSPPLKTTGNACTCCRYARELIIDVVCFDKYESLTLWASECNPAANQLIRSGLFPCAPVYPTLAVDIRMLDFVTRLFLRVAPNHTAWCGAVEDYLYSQGYKLKGKDPLRRRFGNALCWFNSLQSATDMHVRSLLEHTRSEIREPLLSVSAPSRTRSRLHQASVEEVEDEDTASHVDPDPTSSIDIEFDTTPGQDSRKRHHSSEDRCEGEEGSVPLDRPSEYLRSRCPVCFGGDFNQETKRLTW